MVVTIDTQFPPQPVASDTDAEPIAMVLAELRALRVEVQAQRQEILDLRHQVGVPSPVFIHVEEAARRLGCARTQVFKLLCQGRLRRGKSVGRRTMISVASLEALQAGEVQTQPRRRIAHPRRAEAKAQALAAAIRDLPL